MMGSNRKLPFGYQMERGRIVTCPEEVKLIRLLYNRYEQGDSLKALTEWIQKQGISYDGDKTWNKNMIARILGDVRYTGEKGFPEIIHADIFTSIQEKRSKRTAPIQQTEAQKILRQKFGGKVTQDMEMQILAIINSLILYPELIQAPPITSIMSPQITAMETKLENSLAALPVDMGSAHVQIFELAVARYQELNPADYESEKLQREFRKWEPMTELDADLLRKVVTAIHTDSNGSVKLELKNKQIIQQREKERP